MEWIKVTDRLPEDDCFCLVMLKSFGTVVRYFNEFHKSWDDESGDDHFSHAVGGKVNHWMALPSPPQE